MGKPLTAEIRQAIVTEYFKCRPINDIAKEFDICHATIPNCVKMLGFKPRRVTIRALTFEQREEIKKLYDSGTNTHQLAKQFNVSVPSICYVLKRRKTIMRESAFKKSCELDESIFNKVTERSAYWLGFMMADGYVRPGHPPQLSLHLATIDIDQVRKFKQFLKTTNKLSIRKTSIRIQIRSQQLVDRLKNYGIGFNGIRNPSPELLINRHFWRGVIDGDGSIGRFKTRTGIILPTLHLIGNEGIIKGWIAFINSIRQTGVNPSRIKSCVKPTFQVSITHRPAHAVLKELYRDCEIFLERKKKIADEFICKPYPILSGTRKPILA